MSTETNQEAPVTPETTETVVEKPESDTIAVSREEYAKLQETLGSLKRELKDFKKPKAEEATTKPDSSDLLQKTFLRSAGISKEKEVELALSTAKKWGMPVDKLVDDVDFQAKLEKFRTDEANVEATSEIRGGGNSKTATQTEEYWLAKGVPPTPDQVPDRKLRAKIARSLVAKHKGTGGNPFYNGK